jgi:Protein of unknown function (DUF1573)
MAGPVPTTLVPSPGGAERPSSRDWKVRIWQGIMILMLFAFAGTAVGGGIHFYKTVWHVPSLEIRETKLDLGNGKPNEVVRGVLRLKNTGRAPLEFSAQGSCGCTELTPKSATILPGDEQQVAIALQLAGHTNSERSVQISVKSNDPQRGEVHCSATARCPGPCRVSPAFLNFGQLTRAQLAGAVQRLRISPIEGGEPLDPDTLSIVSRSQALRIEASPEDKFTFRVSLTGELAVADLFDELEVKVAQSEPAVRIPVHVQVVEPVSTVPTTIYLRRKSTGDQYEPIDVLLVDRRKQMPIEEVSLVGSTGTFQLEQAGKAAPHILRLRLIARAGGEIPSVLNLKCNGLDDPISIRVAAAK